MRKLQIFVTLAAFVMLPFLAQAQEAVEANIAEMSETRYVTDLIFTPVRTGPGGDYRIINKGLPSGTKLNYYGLSDEGIWAEIETKGAREATCEHSTCRAMRPEEVRSMPLKPR